MSLGPGAKPLEPFGERLECYEGENTGRRADWPCHVSRETQPSLQFPTRTDGARGLYADRAAKGKLLRCGRAKSPVFFAAPGRRSSSPLSWGSFLALRHRPEGAERQKARPFQSVPRSSRNAGASRRSTTAFFRRRAALLRQALQRAHLSTCRPSRTPSASSSRRVVVPASGAPAPPGWREERSSPTPRAPHPAPPSRRL